MIRGADHEYYKFDLILIFVYINLMNTVASAERLIYYIKGKDIYYFHL